MTCSPITEQQAAASAYSGLSWCCPNDKQDAGECMTAASFCSRQIDHVGGAVVRPTDARQHDDVHRRRPMTFQPCSGDVSATLARVAATSGTFKVACGRADRQPIVLCAAFQGGASGAKRYDCLELNSSTQTLAASATMIAAIPMICSLSMGPMPRRMMHCTPEEWWRGLIYVIAAMSTARRGGGGD